MLSHTFYWTIPNVTAQWTAGRIETTDLDSFAGRRWEMDFYPDGNTVSKGKKSTVSIGLVDSNKYPARVKVQWCVLDDKGGLLHACNHGDAFDLFDTYRLWWSYDLGDIDTCKKWIIDDKLHLSVTLTLQKPAALPPSSELAHDQKQLLDNGLFSDVTFVIGADELASHSCLLAARSPVFKTMLTIDMQERKTRRVHLEDVSTDTMRLVLEYVYTADVTLGSWAKTMDVLLAADRFQMASLLRHCSQRLVGILEIESRVSAPHKLLELLHLGEKLPQVPSVPCLRRIQRPCFFSDGIDRVLFEVGETRSITGDGIARIGPGVCEHARVENRMVQVETLLTKKQMLDLMACLAPPSKNTKKRKEPSTSDDDSSEPGAKKSKATAAATA